MIEVCVWGGGGEGGGSGYAISMHVRRTYYVETNSS